MTLTLPATVAYTQDKMLYVDGSVPGCHFYNASDVGWP